jgi:hypothetical protein
MSSLNIFCEMGAAAASKQASGRGNPELDQIWDNIRYLITGEIFYRVNTPDPKS